MKFINLFYLSLFLICLNAYNLHFIPHSHIDEGYILTKKNYFLF